jgi:hypothetical protein
MNDELKEGHPVFSSSFGVHSSSFLCYTVRQTRFEGAKAEVADKPKVANEISEGTGQFDNRFVLWRRFCAETGVSVETLPSDLTGEHREKWEKLKSEVLRKPSEGA